MHTAASGYLRSLTTSALPPPGASRADLGVQYEAVPLARELGAVAIDERLLGQPDSTTPTALPFGVFGVPEVRDAHLTSM
ncbi:hypothetical protein ACIBF6_07405 [Streptosporangium amethystogenes]|uniref:hypothetical protein n=1 Tax=Streptosporangium amethystogenes TaxID=2002 RepID=UPI00378EFDE2